MTSLIEALTTISFVWLGIAVQITSLLNAHRGGGCEFVNFDTLEKSANKISMQSFDTSEE